MADPKYVRLVTHLARGGRYDLNSGWGISGLDVKEMPDADTQPNAYRYVRGELAQGRLEGASRAEYDEAHPDLLAELDAGAPHQEAKVQRAALKVHRKVTAARRDQGELDSYEADERRRKAALKAQKAQSNRTDSKGKAKAAAEAEDEADAATQELLEREAEVRQRGGNLNPRGVDEDDDDDATEDDEYEAMSKPQLVDEAKRRELPHSGSADAIRDRLRAHDAAGDDGDDEGDEEESDDDESEDDGSEDDSNQS